MKSYNSLKIIWLIHLGPGSLSHFTHVTYNDNLGCLNTSWLNSFLPTPHLLTTDRMARLEVKEFHYHFGVLKLAQWIFLPILLNIYLLYHHYTFGIHRETAESENCLQKQSRFLTLFQRAYEKPKHNCSH